MANNLLICISCSLLLSLIQCDITQNDRNTLIDVYSSTNGPHWKNRWNLSTLQNGTVCPDGLYGVVCGYNNITIIRINLRSNELSGTIPASIGNLTSLTNLLLYSNELSGTIPTSIGNLTSLTYLSLFSNELSGTIPESFGNLTSLTTLYLYYNQLNGTIPASIGNLTSLTILLLDSNELSGTIPASIGNLTSLWYLYLHFNELSGTIPASIGNLISLECILFANNHLSFDVVSFVNRLLKYNNSLRVISFSNNANIYGNINMLTEKSINLQYFIGHKCNLYGFFPLDMQFQNLEYFTVYGNRLSGTLPQHLLNASKISKSLILSGNLFEIDGEPPNWLSKSSPFASAESLYITKKEKIISYLLIIITGCFVVFLLLQKCIEIFTKTQSDQTAIPRKVASADNLNTEWFLMNIENIMSSFNMKFIVLSTLLIFIYYYNANYFMYSLLTSQVTISYFESNDVSWNFIVILLWLAYFTFIAYSITNTQSKQKHNINDIPIATKPDDDPPKTCKALLLSLLYFVIYLFLFICCNGLVILSIIFESLPDHNIFEMDEYGIQSVTKSIGCILAINTAIIIPKFVDSIYDLFISSKVPSRSVYICKYRPIFILLLRSCSIILIPFISSIYLSGNCGNGWTKYWSRCDPLHRDAYFNITVNIEGIDTPLLKQEEVCESKYVEDINWDKCIRFYTSQWSSILCTKLITMMFMPFLIIGLKKLKYIVLSYGYILCCDKCGKFASNDITVDMQYAMILTKCETMIVFGIISPAIVPLTVISMQINYYSYRWIIHRQKWSVKPFNAKIEVPVYMLWGSLLISQLFICSFSYFCMDSKVYSYILVATVLFIDIMFILMNIKQNKRKNEVISHDDVPIDLNILKKELLVGDEFKDEYENKNNDDSIAVAVFCADLSVNAAGFK